MVVYLKNSIHSLLSIFKKKARHKGNEDHKGLAVHYRASQHYPENVFIEGSRPQYLEDLHTEALEGLKILQQEEYNGVNYSDDESIASTDTLRPEQDFSSKDSGGSPEPGIPTGNSMTTLTSAVSATSTRPVLTRQGSTFKPLNPVKRTDKCKKRNRRTTIMGIPHQVQRELALHRSSTFQQVPSSQLTSRDQQVDDGQSTVDVIPTINGECLVSRQEGAKVRLADLEHVSREDQLLRNHLQVVYQEDQPFSHQGLGSHYLLTIGQRPKSLAVPGMTTSSSTFGFLLEPQGPVMSISPQATYLSKIIPNAVLPASVEVIQIDRSSSRTLGSNANHSGSVHTVSKSSLASVDLSVSPASSRRSEGDGSNTDDYQNSRPITTTISGTDRTQSQSSETIISNSSPMSSKQNTGIVNSGSLTVQGSQQTLGGDQDHVSLRSSVSWVSSLSSKSVSPGKGQGSESEVVGTAPAESMKNSRSQARSLSVMKTKLPPAPPRRTNSLYNDRMKCAAEDVSSKDGNAVNIKEEPESISGSRSLNDFRSSVSSGSFSPSQDSAGAAVKPPERLSEPSSSPQKTPSDGDKFERTMSPSSGYSSQSGTPTLSSKGISPTSPDKLKRKPVKPERSGSRASSSAASASSSLTSLSSATSDLVNQEASANSPSPPQQESPPCVAATEKTTHINFAPSSTSTTIRELFNIPPSPKVKAPCPPPPETWAHNRRTVELLCGPKISRLSHLPTTGQPVKESPFRKLGEKPEATEEAESLAVIQSSESKERVFPEDSRTSLEVVAESVSQEIDRRDCQNTEQLAKDTETQETLNNEPLPVMRGTMSGTIREESLSAEKSVDEQQQVKCNSIVIKVHMPEENHTSSSQPGAEVPVYKSEDVMERREMTSLQTLTVDAPKVKESPPPSPPPAYHPKPPPYRKTPPSSISTPPTEELEGVQEESTVIEACWPPPPPPLEGDLVFEGGDELDFPPPPPLFVSDILSDVLDHFITKTEVPDQPVASTEEVKVTITHISDRREVVNEENAVLPVSVPQTSEEVTRSQEVTQGHEVNSTDTETYRPLLNISSLPESVPPPPMEAPPPPPPITSTEMPLSNSTLEPAKSVLPPPPTQTEDKTPLKPPVSAPISPPISVPLSPPPPAEVQSPGVTFRRQPSLAKRDTKSKELLSRHKSVPIPKEDANIPLVTPSLLQMVRLRSVSMVEDQLIPPPEDKKSQNGVAPAQQNVPIPTPGPQSIPQKPIRKSLSLKSPTHTVKTSSVPLNSPSMRLQEAIRMKTAAMTSRDGLPSRLGLRSSISSSFSEAGGTPYPKSTEGGNLPKSPASTASFIFSRSTKKVVIETILASSPEAQGDLKQSLVAELIRVSDKTKAAAMSNGGVKCDKVPPPVAKKPAHGSTSPSHKATVQPTGHKVSPTETTTTVMPDTIETLF